MGWLSGVTVYAAQRPDDQAGVLSFAVVDRDGEEIGEKLGARDIAVRAGLHCAPYAHESAGTLEKGTVRASFSYFNSPADAQRLVLEMARLTV